VRHSARLLSILLRLVGSVALLAVVGLLMPTAWMALCHERLGLGGLPEGPVFEYLARSTSAFYALTGGLLWVLSTDVHRYARVITYVAVGGLFFSVAILVTDIVAALPMFWTIGETIANFGTCIAVLILQGDIRRSADTRQEREVDS